MRGTRLSHDTQRRYDRIIPAHAGNTMLILSFISVVMDHPRTCGEHESRDQLVSHLPGSSPHMRGTPELRISSINALGIIPAHAGNTMSAVRYFRRSGDHPRTCGEHLKLVIMQGTPRGSSPHMRGTHKFAFQPPLKGGIIPAHAGNTSSNRPILPRLWDHPRTCGEHPIADIGIDFSSGSSPHMRGTPHR